ncbi:hypothetical protein [Propioniciclava soli]|uniref:Chemotaxis protein n=1 Tax=Propioniciclava soli TaxID=2775081 RepID=A0ABZ3CCE8_9ACTN|nr:hypothetical protein [Propioniciclava soli]
MSEDQQNFDPFAAGAGHAHAQRGEQATEERNHDAADADPSGADAPEPGHLGNDLSKMTLLDTDLEELAAQEAPEPDESIQTAIHDLQAVTDKHDIPGSLP